MCHALTLRSWRELSSTEMSKIEITNFAHGVGQNSFHLVWKPKYAWDCFKFPGVKADSEVILKEAISRYGMQLYELEVMLDHVHCFVKVPPT